MHSSSGRTDVELLGPLQAALGEGHVVLVGLLLAPVVGCGAARASAVVGDGRGAVDVSGEQEDGCLKDMLRLRPQGILRNDRILLEEIEHGLGNLDGILPVPDGDRLVDLGRGDRLDRLLLLFLLRLRILLRLGCDRTGRLGLADRLPLELLSFSGWSSFQVSWIREGVRFLLWPRMEDLNREWPHRRV